MQWKEVMPELSQMKQNGSRNTESGVTSTYPEIAYEVEEYDGGLSYQMSAKEYAYPDWNTEEYSYYAENGWVSASTTPLSTFAADVDTASYSNVRRMLLEGGSVPADAVRIEEMINYFHYDYELPAGDDAPFAAVTEMAPCPWNEDTYLLQIGLSTQAVDFSEIPSSNLVFLIDVSGSMADDDKLPLLKRAFALLTENMRDEDVISIVTYANHDTVVLDGGSGRNKGEIRRSIEELEAYGGTNGSDGIIRAYELAEKHWIEGGNNRIILATDGDLNIGMSDEGSLTRLIQEKAKSGVYLSVLGFGEGNISDTNMEALADHGNGNYSYIDSIMEARRTLVDEMGSTLYTVAKDVKIQVDFNPAIVKGYRLIGYENRKMEAQDFADDTKDGGEIGAGHQVTVLYEIALTGSEMDLPEVTSRYTQTEANRSTESVTEASDLEVAETETEKKLTQLAIAGKEETPETTTNDNGTENELLTVCVRYKEPDGEESILREYPFRETQIGDEMSENMSWAAGVAQAGMILKDSTYLGSTNLDEVKARLGALEGTHKDESREEFLYLLGRIEQ
ncbi:MAG: VWA domain-containing protein [Lachnospiraceae bacterium]|nr:VWA domain-containing protein [Lachnospiraceae bacterium]